MRTHRLLSDPPPDFKYERTLTVGENTVTLTFEWWGGEYIEVYAKRPDYFGEPESEDGELINVWGADGKPRIPRTQEALEDKAEEWLRNYGCDADSEGEGRARLMHDILVNWRWT